MWALVEARAQATPDAVMVVDEHDRALTFAQFRNHAVRAAAGFAARGVTADDTVAWQLPTRTEALVLMAALARIGARQLALLPMYRERELTALLRRTGARVWCVPGVFRGVDHPALAARVCDQLAAEEGVERIDVVVCDPALPDADPSALAPAPPTPTASGPRWVFATSGTTAEPKAALHTDRSIMAGGAAFAIGQGVRPDDRYGIAFPLTHIGGANNLAASLQSGCSLAICETFEPTTTVAGFRRQGVTIAGGGPAFYQALLDVQRDSGPEPILPRLRFLTGGGAPMPPEMHHEARRLLGAGCAHGYGMTECCIVAINDPTDDDEHLSTTVGRPVPQVALRIVDPDGVERAPETPGEIRIRGDAVFAGYLDPVENTAAWDDGWFLTGDLGFLDARGYLHVTGRIKDLIIRKGENISATELEALLYEHPAVSDVAVIGLPDRARGERVCAVVCTYAGQPLTLDDLTAFCVDAGIMRQKIPEQLELVDSLPRNATGKVLKAELRAQFEKQA